MQIWIFAFEVLPSAGRVVDVLAPLLFSPPQVSVQGTASPRRLTVGHLQLRILPQIARSEGSLFEKLGRRVHEPVPLLARGPYGLSDYQ